MRTMHDPAETMDETQDWRRRTPRTDHPPPAPAVRGQVRAVTSPEPRAPIVRDDTAPIAPAGDRPAPVPAPAPAASIAASAVSRTVLVTGAASPFGAQAALALAARGHRVVAAGEDQAALEALAAGSDAITPWPLALRDTGGLEGDVHALLRAHGGLDAVVHAASVHHALRLDDLAYDLPALEEELRTNLAAPMELTRVLLPWLRARPSAVLVFVTSGLATAPTSSGSVHCATQAALKVFADSLRGQLADSAIRVVEVVVPVDTGERSPRAAEAILEAIESQRERLYSGGAWWWSLLMGVAPGLARRWRLRR